MTPDPVAECNYSKKKVECDCPICQEQRAYAKAVQKDIDSKILTDFIKG